MTDFPLFIKIALSCLGCGALALAGSIPVSIFVNDDAGSTTAAIGTTVGFAGVIIAVVGGLICLWM